MGVYGDMLAVFPELLRKLTVWTKEDKSDERTIRGAFMPTRGDRLEYQKYANRGKAIQYYEEDRLFVSRHYSDKIDIGDFFYDPDGGHIHRIVEQMNLLHQGGYICFTTERVTGTTVDQTEELKIKEAVFD